MTAPTDTPEALARFGHHPDPAIDFVVEVEAIEGELADLAAGLTPTMDIDARIARAMMFRVGANMPAIRAKTALRQIEAGRLAASVKRLAVEYANASHEHGADAGCDDPELFAVTQEARTAFEAEVDRLAAASAASLVAEPVNPVAHLTVTVNIDDHEERVHTKVLPNMNSAALPAGEYDLYVRAGDYRDAYEGAREDLLDWKRRAIDAEAKQRDRYRELNAAWKCLEEDYSIPNDGKQTLAQAIEYAVSIGETIAHKLGHLAGFNEANGGTTFMGEPAQNRCAMRMQFALEEVCRVLQSDTSAIIDTVWVSTGAPETLLDHCLSALAAPLAASPAQPVVAASDTTCWLTPRDWESECDECAGAGKVDRSELEEDVQHLQWQESQEGHERDLDALHEECSRHSHDATHWFKTCNEAHDCIRSVLEECQDCIDCGNGFINTGRIQEIIARAVGELPSKSADDPRNYVDGPRVATPKAEPPASGLRSETDAGGEVS